MFTLNEWPLVYLSVFHVGVEVVQQEMVRHAPKSCPADTVEWRGCPALQVGVSIIIGSHVDRKRQHGEKKSTITIKQRTKTDLLEMSQDERADREEWIFRMIAVKAPFFFKH